jgi:hypothetical protein
MLWTMHYLLQALLSAKKQIIQKAQNPVEQFTQLGFAFSVSASPTPTLLPYGK